MSKNAIEMNFWRLLKNQKNDHPMRIIVPDLQRDYAEGRKDDETKQIRENLVNQICLALCRKDEKNLNFIYGTLKENKDKEGNVEYYAFCPVDGQQRLTTLFLLYWYVFYKNQDVEGRKNDISVLRGFSYQTRTTTEYFCDKLCNMDSIPTRPIDEYIKNQNWYTGNIDNDPSVNSMLVVLKCIEENLYSILDRDSSLSFNELAERLKQCRISFYWLDVGSFDEEDLYIKMNSRGKYLTEFESFKARLQPSEDNATILNSVFDDTSEAIEFIGRINNEYTNAFYRECGVKKNRNGAPSFDNTMMSFFMSVIKCDQFAYAVGLNEVRGKGKKYRGIFNSTDSGSVFYERFVKTPLKQWEENGFFCIRQDEVKKCLIHSIKKIDYFLGNYEKLKTIASPFGTKQYSQYGVSGLLHIETPTAKDHLRLYAIMEYVYAFKPDFEGENDLKKYYMWVRFVANLLENARDSKGDGFSDTTDTCETVFFFKKLIEWIHDEVKFDDDYIVLISCIRKACDRFFAEYEKYPVSIKNQLNEEKRKILLMSINNAEWEHRILTAEEYFIDGQISFLFDYLKSYDETSDCIESFDRCFDIAKKLFKGDKSPNTDAIRWEDLQTAAFRCEDSSKDKMSWLKWNPNWPMKTGKTGVSSYKEMLSGGDLRKVFESCDRNPDIETGLKSVEEREYPDEEKWKKPFAEALLHSMVEYNNEHNEYCFSFTIAFRGDTILLLCKEQRTSGPSMEINTFILYEMLSGEIKKELHFETGDAVCNDEGQPLRYVCCGRKIIGYSPLKKGYVEIAGDNESIYDLETAIRVLSESAT